MKVDSFTYAGVEYDICIYDENMLEQLEAYCRQCEADQNVNNSSIKKLKLGRLEDERWWCVTDRKTNSIVSLAAAYHCKEISEGTYRVMYRAGTISSYRGKAGPMSKLQKSCFVWGRMLPHHVDYCLDRGATDIVFTTNTSGTGTASSNRQDRVCRLIFETNGMAKKIKTMNLLGAEQNIWRVLIHNVYDKSLIPFPGLVEST
jgi:hypothetical protein